MIELDAERGCELQEEADGGRALARFDLPDHGATDAGQRRKPLERVATPRALTLEVLAEHRRQIGGGISPRARARLFRFGPVQMLSVAVRHFVPTALRGAGPRNGAPPRDAEIKTAPWECSRTRAQDCAHR